MSTVNYETILFLCAAKSLAATYSNFLRYYNLVFERSVNQQNGKRQIKKIIIRYENTPPSHKYIYISLWRWLPGSLCAINKYTLN